MIAAVLDGQATTPGPPMKSAVRGWCLCFLAWLAPISDGDLNGPLLGAADDVEVDGAALRGLERVEQLVGGADRVTCAAHNQVALREAGACGWAVFLHVADEQAVGVGQADGAAEPPGHVVRGDGKAEPRRLR